jgi:hypothetical protein
MAVRIGPEQTAWRKRVIRPAISRIAWTVTERRFHATQPAENLIKRPIIHNEGQMLAHDTARGHKKQAQSVVHTD